MFIRLVLGVSKNMSFEHNTTMEENILNFSNTLAELVDLDLNLTFYHWLVYLYLIFLGTVKY